MLSGLIASLPMALLGAFGYAFIASLGCFIIVHAFTGNQLITTLAQVLPAVGVATILLTPGTLAFWLVCCTPFIAGVIISVFQGLFNVTIAGPLARRGYLGNLKKWIHEVDATPEFNAATQLLSDERIREVADFSTDADDFHDNIVRAAGLEDHEVPEDF